MELVLDVFFSWFDRKGTEKGKGGEGGNQLINVHPSKLHSA